MYPLKYLPLLCIALALLSCKRDKQLPANTPDKTNTELGVSELAAIDKRMATEYDSIRYWDEHKNIDNADNNLEVANATFKDDLLAVLNKYPQSLHYGFKFLDKPVTSPDKKLRAYSWDTQMGGTMRDLQTIFQYQVKNGVKAEKFTDMGEDGEIYLCTDIFSVQTKGGIVYIAVTFMTESSLYHYRSVKFLMIKDDKLTPINFIKTTDDLKDNLGIEYINYYNEDNPNIPKKLIDFDPKNQILKIVKTDAQQHVINTFDRYTFNGTHFEKQD